MKRIGTETRRELLSFTAIDPKTGKNSVVVSLDARKLQYIGRRSQGQTMETAELVPFILNHPRQVYEGLCWDEDEIGSRGVGWRCYSGLPECAYQQDGKRIEPYKDEVFLVFVDDTNLVYNWRWEKSKSAAKGIPDEFDLQHGDGKRFKKELL